MPSSASRSSSRAFRSSPTPKVNRRVFALRAFLEFWAITLSSVSPIVGWPSVMNITRCGLGESPVLSCRPRTSASSIAVPPMASNWATKFTAFSRFSLLAGRRAGNSGSTSVEKRTMLKVSCGLSRVTQYLSASRAIFIRSPCMEPEVSITKVTRLAAISSAFTSDLGAISATK